MFGSAAQGTLARSRGVFGAGAVDGFWPAVRGEDLVQRHGFCGPFGVGAGVDHFGLGLGLLHRRGLGHARKEGQQWEVTEHGRRVTCRLAG